MDQQLACTERGATLTPYADVPLDTFLADYESLIHSAAETSGPASDCTPSSGACNNYFSQPQVAAVHYLEPETMRPDVAASQTTDQHTASTQSHSSKVFVEGSSMSSPEYVMAVQKAPSNNKNGAAARQQGGRRRRGRKRGQRTVLSMAPPSLSGVLRPFGFVKKYTAEGGVNLQQLNAMILALETPAAA